MLSDKNHLKYRKALFLCLFCILISFRGRAQSHPKIYNYNEQFGNRGRISDIKTDSQNLLWIIGFSSVVYYDGSKFKDVYKSDINSSLLVRFYEGPNGDKFVGDNWGQLFAIRNDTLYPHEFNDTILSLNKRKQFVNIAFDSSKNIHYNIPDKGYLIIDSLGNTQFPLREKEIDIHGIVLIYNKGLDSPFTFSQSKIEDMGKQPFVYLINDQMELVKKTPIQVSSNTYPQSLSLLNNGNYLLSNRGRLLEFNEEGIVSNIKYDTHILNLLSDRNGGLWVSGHDEIRYYKSGSIHSEYIPIMQETFSVVSAEDYQGGIWIHSQEKGLNQIRFPQSVFYSQEDILPYSNVVEVFKDSIILGCLGNNLALADVESNQTKVIKTPFHEKKDIIGIHYDSLQKTLWVSQRHKVMHRSNGNWKSLSTKKLKTGARLYKVYFEGETADSNRFIIGAHRSQFFYIKDTAINYVSPIYPSPLVEVAAHNDSVLVGAVDGVYLQIKDSIIDLKKQYPFLKNLANKIAYFDGKFWISFLRKGLYTLEKDSISRVFYDGRAVDGGHIIKRGNNELWLINSHSNYLFSMNNEALVDTMVYAPVPKFWTLKIASNMKSLYFARYNVGVVRTDFADILSKPLIPPSFFIKNVFVNEAKRKLDTIYSLEAEENNIRIEYSGLNFSDWDIHFRYRMEGSQNNWVTTDETNLLLVGLPPGEHIFEIQASITGQPWTSSKRLCFNIAPPYWQTWWFISIVAILITFIIYSIFRYRIQIVKNEKSLIVGKLKAEQRALRAKLSPHFVFNVISSLQYLISDNKPDKAIKFLEGFSMLMRRMVDQSDIEYITIEKEVEFLRGYIELEKLRFEDKFDYKIIFENIKNNQALIPNFILQPIIENCIQHGLKNKKGIGLLKVKLTQKAKLLQIVIEDNGVGYNRTMNSTSNKNKKHKSKGIETIVSRIELHNNDSKIKGFEIFDLSDKRNEEGTLVEVNLKLT